ncbi:uncharacterized protein RHOBADRAFT_46921 [Rhodotorula graminis WP1]|uniref:F-box domain-containing protein n=1 Tax=Rhodotorula graminis (strain WP1) TaxID=578459 RepID=A0A0P9FA38_RHOGW|nr:uncharacterized protein RHOBADRAFT_46921 [Rhodotorula graminis WP1]KPV72468.1 hypothetical protein RHOBADRAFT_46921 [Rhodotorula graminis WP1]
MSSSALPVTPPAEPVVAAAAAGAPRSSSLPDELWLKILGDLDYSGLQKAAQLCKKFKGFLQDPSFDDALFRAQPPKELAVGMEVIIHPLLHGTDCLFEGKHAVTRACFVKGGRERTAFRYKAVDDFATSPSCCLMYLDVGLFQCVRIIDTNGITVRRVLKGLGRFWGSRPPEWYVAEVFGGWCDDEDEDELEDVTWRSMLDGYDMWTGWEKAGVETDDDGVLSVVLTAKPFSY